MTYVPYNELSHLMLNFDLIDEFLLSLSGLSIDEIIEEIENELNENQNIKDQFKRQTLDDSEATFAIYLDDLEFILHGLKSKVNASESWPDFLFNDLQRNRRNELKKKAYALV